MSKKKVMSISILSVLLIYLLCMSVSFISAGFSVENDFKNHIEEINGKTELYSEKYFSVSIDENGKESTADFNVHDKYSIIKEMFLDRMQFPYCAGFFDTQGNLAAYTTSFLELEVEDIKTKEVKVYRSELADIIDKDNLEYLFKTCEEMELDRSSISVEKMDYNLDGDKVIPTYLQVSVNSLLIDLKISDEKAQYHLNSFEGTEDSDKFSKHGSIYVHMLPGDSFKEKIDYELSLKLQQMFKNAGEKNKIKCPAEGAPSISLGDVEFTVPGKQSAGSSGADLGFRSSHFILSKAYYDPYTLVVVTERAPFYSIVLSEYFERLAAVTNYIGLVLIIIVPVLTSIIYDKNKRLENSRKAFINAAAHELKTPLAVITNNCECIIENVSPEKNDSYVNTIYNESKRMTKLTQMLINYNRVMQKGKVEKAKTDLGELAKKECEKYKSLFESKNMKLKVVADSAVIKCNEALITLAVDNFLSNAAKYAKEDSEVLLSVKKTKLGVAFCIYNECEKIAEEDLSHLWEELYRVDKSRNSNDNSTGMGLAINRQIFELHKFKYKVQNKDRGVEFSFTAK